MDTDPKLEAVKGNQILYWSLVGLSLAIYAILLILSWATWNVKLLNFTLLGFPIIFNLGFLFDLPVILHVAKSIRFVATDMLGATYFYGKALGNAGQGPHFVPWPSNIELGPRDIQQVLVPGKKDDIFWGDEKLDLPEGKVRPIFMNTRAPTDAEKAPLDVQMTVGVSYVVFWKIDNLLMYLAHIRTVEECEAQLRSISETVLSETIATMTVNGAISGQAEINQKLDNRIRERTGDWGITVTRASLTQINPSHKLAEAMRDRATAKFNADAVVIAANAEGERRERLGKADAMAEEARVLAPLTARAKGLKGMMDGLNVGGSEVLAHSGLIDALPKSSLILGEPGIAGMFGLVKAGADALRTQDEKGSKQ